MASLIHLISNLSDARYGVNILEENPPGAVQGVGTNVVAVVADLPWGPVDTVTDITGNAELFDTFAPLPFDVLDDYPALKAFINKTFPNTVKVVRIPVTGAATSAFTFVDGSAGDSVDVDANYPGVVGDQIAVAWSVNADDATKMDATVTIGTKYSATYEAIVEPDGGGSITVTDPGDPYVTFSAAAGATGVPAAIAATNLASGADGTAVSGDYLGTPGTGSGLEEFADANVDWDVLFVAEPPDGLVGDINDGLKTFVDSYDRGFVILCTPASETPSAAQTDVASHRADRLFRPWPLVKTVNVYDGDRPEITVQGNSFAAAAVASVPPEISPGGAPGAQYLRGITGLEQSASLTTYKALNDAGIAPFIMSSALEGAIIHRGVTTSLTSGRTKIFRRRMTDYIVQSLAARLEQYTGEPLDLDLSNQALGAITGPEVGELRQFMQDLADGDPPRIRQYSLDPFGGNLQSNIDAGQWIILLAVKLLSMQEEIVLRASIGESVEIDEAA